MLDRHSDDQLGIELTAEEKDDVMRRLRHAREIVEEINGILDDQGIERV